MGSVVTSKEIQEITTTEEEEEEEDMVDSFISLPDESVVRIFSYLPVRDVLRGLSGVSRRFRGLSAHNVSEFRWWSGDRGGRAGSRKRVLQLEHLLRLASRLRALSTQANFDGGEINACALLARKALERCPMLECLEVSHFEPGALCRAIGEHGVSLRKLGLTSNYNLSRSGLDPSSLGNLTHLHLANVTVEDETLAGIGRHCKVLLCVNIRNSSPTTANVKFVLGREGVTALLRGGLSGTLRKLCLQEVCVEALTRKNTLEGCQRLEMLCIATGRQPLDEDLFPIICRLSRLSVLSVHILGNSPDLTGFFAGIKELAGLRVLWLRIPWIYDDVLTDLSNSCPGLVNLTLWHGGRLTKGAIWNLARGRCGDGIERLSVLPATREMLLAIRDAKRSSSTTMLLLPRLRFVGLRPPGIAPYEYTAEGRALE